ncbi:hypothetical protein [Streptosporangium sp. NPDC006007]|uniref:hypothetical protein n=1 Tax=Streptosporangium sp. NPDC006007 TaxID=3154575 RepID=UPI0033BD804B
MTAEGRDEVRELMVRHNPVLPHEVRQRMGRGDEEEILRRILRDIASRRTRRRGPALAVAALGAAAATVISLCLPPGAPRTPPSAGAVPSPVAGRVGPRITEDLARITRISNTEPLPAPSPRPMAVFPRASARLLELAAIAADRPRPVTRPWGYVTTEEWLPATTVAPAGTTSEVVPWVVRRWTPVSGRGTYLRVRTAGRPFGGGEAEIPPEAGRARPPADRGVGLVADRDTGLAADLRPRAAELSRSAPELRGQLLGSEPQTTMTVTRRLVRAVENLHSHDVVEPALSAALWRVFAAQDDLRLFGRVRDRSGRPGEAFGFEDGPLLGVFVVSPATGGLLATELIRVGGTGGPGGARPAVEEYRTYLAGRWVNGAGRTS